MTKPKDVDRPPVHAVVIERLQGHRWVETGVRWGAILAIREFASPFPRRGWRIERRIVGGGAQGSAVRRKASVRRKGRR